MAAGSGYDAPGVYEIRVKGRLGKMWSEWFDGFEITLIDEETLLKGQVIDQAALHGILAKVRDVGLILVSVRQADEDQ
jgi:hypothetical protein